MLLTQKNFISEKTFLQVSKMLTLIISYSNIVYLVSNFPSFLDLICYRGNSVFFTFPTILSRKLILSTFAPSLENTTKSNHTGKLIFFIPGGIIVERIIVYQFNQYVCFYHDIAWKSSWKRLIYIQCSLGLSPPLYRQPHLSPKFSSVQIPSFKNTPLYCQTQLPPSATGFQTQKS